MIYRIFHRPHQSMDCRCICEVNADSAHEAMVRSFWAREHYVGEFWARPKVLVVLNKRKRTEVTSKWNTIKTVLLTELWR